MVFLVNSSFLRLSIRRSHPFKEVNRKSFHYGFYNLFLEQTQIFYQTFPCRILNRGSFDKIQTFNFQLNKNSHTRYSILLFWKACIYLCLEHLKSLLNFFLSIHKNRFLWYLKAQACIIQRIHFLCYLNCYLFFRIMIQIWFIHLIKGIYLSYYSY